MAALDSQQISSEAKAVELLASVSGLGLANGPVGFAQAFGMSEQFAGYLLRIGKALGALFGQHVPHGHQEFAGNGHDGLVVSQARFETRKLGVPMGMDARSSVSGFDHGGANVAPPSLGDSPGAARETAVVDATTQASVTHQALVLGEACDVADGGQQRHGGDQADARQLDQQRDPFVLGRCLGQGLFQQRNLGPGEDQGLQVALNAHSLYRCDGQLEPPLMLLWGEQVTLGWQHMITMQRRVQAVLGLGRQTHHLGPLRNQGAVVAHLQRRHPH